MSDPLLRRLEAFGPLPEADRVLLSGIGSDARQVAAGTDLIREGDRPEGVFLVLEGFVGRYKLRSNGLRQIMAYLVPGDFTDLDVMLLSRMDDNIVALSASVIMRMAPETIEALRQRPALARALRMATLVDAATAREWLVNVGRRSATERLAHLLCELLLRLETVGLASQVGYDLPLTHTDLADTTGLTNVHINRALQQLTAEGLIDFRHRRVVILDLPRLQHLAEFRSNYLHLGDQAAA